MNVLFFFNDTATTEIYTLSLHDALPISNTAPSPGMTGTRWSPIQSWSWPAIHTSGQDRLPSTAATRSEEHTSELQSRQYLVCRLLLEKKNRERPAPRLHHYIVELQPPSD